MNRVSRRQSLVVTVLLGCVLTGALLVTPAAVVRATGGVLADPGRFAFALIGLYLLRPFVAWPLSLVSALCGYVYGFAVGVPIALLGAVGSSLLPFLIARYARTDGGVLGRVGGSGARFFETTGDVRGVVGARLAPAPADAVSYGAGLSGVPTSAFAIGTLVGEIPWTIGFVFVGTTMGEFAVGKVGLDSALPLLGAAVLAALVLAGPAYRYLADELGVRTET